ncbi:fimbria/pilus outer membrane usher protein [Rhodanobacter aciditrophus]|uniref:Fimbria/pilus outer membrane usher protein n=1 Tax=Rhodanobacter aciditrophus TaxID=1623218 RepID=A0ABW4B512_9GAMM
MSMQLDFGAREHGGYENARVGINGSAGENNDLSYGVALSDSQSSGSSVSGNLGYRSRYSALNATYSHTSDYQQVSVGANGSVVLHSGGVTLAPQRGDTMVLVEAPGAENALVSNSSGARVNRDGYAVVPYVSPYRLNTISLDPRGMAHDVELESTSQVIAPYAGAISHLRYETRKGNALLIQIRNADEYGLPFGAQIKDEQGQLVGMVSQGHRLYVRSEQMQGRLLVEWGSHADQHCYVDYQVPSDADASQRGFIQLEALCR